MPIIEQLTTLLTFNQIKKQLELLTDDDILIQPNLKDIRTADFAHTATAISRGYHAVQRHQFDLAHLSLGRQKEIVKMSGFEPPVITDIRLENESAISDRLIASRLRQAVDEPFDRDQLEADLQTLYGNEYFERINYRLDGQTLVVSTIGKSWGTDQLGVNFEIFTDNGVESGYNLGANFRESAISDNGAEWFTIVQIGQDPLARTELYLPIDYRQIFVAEPYIDFRRQAQNLVEGRDIVSHFNIDSLQVGASIGTKLGNVASLAVGLEQHRGDIDEIVGIDTPTIYFKDNIHYVDFKVDTLDNLYFPNRGFLTSIQYRDVNPATHGAANFEQLSVEAVNAIPIGAHSLIFRRDYVRTIGDVSGRQAQGTLGGFLALSGYPDQALVGNNLAYAKLTYLHRMDSDSIFPVHLPVYVGFSLETGHVWEASRGRDWSNRRSTAAITVGMDTPFGPVYFGYGRTDDSQDSFYLRLRRVF